VLVHHFAIERRELLVPVHDLQRTLPGRTHAVILPIYVTP
jgi:hypothetical protein